MKSDLDALMQAHGIDVMLVSGAGFHNPAMVYFTGPVHLTSADLIKKHGEPPVLFHHAMERDEAAKSGLQTIGYNRYPDAALYREAGGDVTRILALRYQRMLRDLGVTSGTVALYGQVDAGQALAVFTELQRLMPGLHLVADLQEHVLRAAMITKDAGEVARIRAVGEKTVAFVARVAEFLRRQRVVEDVLVDGEGRPVTIGAVKQRINLWLAEAGLDNPEETIFAIGHDAGVPHSTGNPSDILRLGIPIVFDIFPCERGGGYFYDFTRTWCLGFATDTTQALYDAVRSVYRQIRSELAVGRVCSDIQQRACQLFEAQGHPTPLNTPGTEIGFPHGLGHGLGTYIHSRPWFRLMDPNQEAIQPGTVLTLEPGLYYPDQGQGVRLEDTLYFPPQGEPEVLVDYPMDLVLPVEGR